MSAPEHFVASVFEALLRLGGIPPNSVTVLEQMVSNPPALWVYDYDNRRIKCRICSFQTKRDTSFSAYEDVRAAIDMHLEMHKHQVRYVIDVLIKGKSHEPEPQWVYTCSIPSETSAVTSIEPAQFLAKR